MFLLEPPDGAAPLAIPQASHAWLAWQLASHWGNRRFVRPTPRPEVLAAVLLHDSGWTEFDLDPGVDGDGRIRTFDRMPVTEHLAIWRTSIARAGQYSRYAGLLVAHHFAALAETKAADARERGEAGAAEAVESFRAEEERRIEGWRAELASDARYESSRDGRGFAANVALLAACDRIAVFLCAGLPRPIDATAPTADGAMAEVRMDEIADGRLRTRPWPFAGDRLRIGVEGRRLSTPICPTGAEMRAALAVAPTVRLGFTLLRPAAGG